MARRCLRIAWGCSVAPELGKNDNFLVLTLCFGHSLVIHFSDLGASSGGGRGGLEIAISSFDSPGQYWFKWTALICVI